MQVLGERYLKSKLFKNYANNRNIDVYFDDESQELILSFIEIKDSQTEDDMIIYNYKAEQAELFYEVVYQVHGLEDLPRWINDINTLKALINYMS